MTGSNELPSGSESAGRKERCVGLRDEGLRASDRSAARSSRPSRYRWWPVELTAMFQSIEYQPGQVAWLYTPENRP